jgi:hypothetical protein
MTPVCSIQARWLTDASELIKDMLQAPGKADTNAPTTALLMLAEGMTV